MYKQLFVVIIVLIESLDDSNAGDSRHPTIYKEYAVVAAPIPYYCSSGRASAVILLIRKIHAAGGFINIGPRVNVLVGEEYNKKNWIVIIQDDEVVGTRASSAEESEVFIVYRCRR